MGAARAGAQTGQEDATMPHLHCHLPTQVSQSASELEAHWSTVALGSTTALQGDASIKRRMLDGAQGGVGQGVTLLAEWPQQRLCWAWSAHQVWSVHGHPRIRSLQGKKTSWECRNRNLGSLLVPLIHQHHRGFFGSWWRCAKLRAEEVTTEGLGKWVVCVKQKQWL